MLVLLGGLYKTLQVPYRDRRLGEPMAGVSRPIRGPLGCRGMGLEEFYTAQRQKLEKRKLQPMLLVLLGEVPVPLFAIHIENKWAKCARQNLSQNEFKFSKHFF